MWYEYEKDDPRGSAALLGTGCGLHQGIEVFEQLESLAMTYHALKTLDLTQNPNLGYVNCSYNRLTELNVHGLPLLQALYCEHNYLESLDLKQDVGLTVIYCRHNLLAGIDFSDNLKLKFIEIFDNRLREIDVSMLKELEFLHVDHNFLTRLDMSWNPNLKGGGFVVRNNDAREILLPNIPGFTVYYDNFAEQNFLLGYEIISWYADPDYTLPITGDVQAEGQTLYGKRIPNDYTIRFDAQGGLNGPANLNAKYDQELTLPQKTPTRKGYRFLGWSKEFYPDVVYLPGQQVKNLGGGNTGGFGKAPGKLGGRAVQRPFPRQRAGGGERDERGKSGVRKVSGAPQKPLHPGRVRFLRVEFVPVGEDRISGRPDLHQSGRARGPDRRSVCGLGAVRGRTMLRKTISGRISIRSPRPI